MCTTLRFILLMYLVYETGSTGKSRLCSLYIQMHDFFSKRNFFRIVFHKMMIAWADLSKQNKNFPLFGSYETPNADKTITWKIWISYWKRKAVLTTNAKKISAQKVYEKYERWQKMRRISFNGLECFVMMKWFGQTLICRYGQRTHSPKYTYIDFIVFPL